MAFDGHKFLGLRDTYRTIVAEREALVRLSFSAAGGRVLTERINSATRRLEHAEVALTNFVTGSSE